MSLIIGGICILISFFLFGMLKEPAFTIGNKLFALLFLYFGWYIAANANIIGDDYDVSKSTVCFLFSRMFVGFCLIVIGFILLHHCFTSVDVFINFTQTDSLQYFLYGNGCILVGMLLFFANRIASDMVAGLLTLLFCALMILQLPTIVLFFKGHKDFIGTYYSNVAFHWSMIVAVIAYGIVAITIFLTSWAWKYGTKQAEQNAEDAENTEVKGWDCSECNEQNDDTAVFCKNCGQYK